MNGWVGLWCGVIYLSPTKENWNGKERIEVGVIPWIDRTSVQTCYFSNHFSYRHSITGSGRYGWDDLCVILRHRSSLTHNVSSIMSRDMVKRGVKCPKIGQLRGGGSGPSGGGWWVFDGCNSLCTVYCVRWDMGHRGGDHRPLCLYRKCFDGFLQGSHRALESSSLLGSSWFFGFGKG